MGSSTAILNGVAVVDLSEKRRSSKAWKRRESVSYELPDKEHPTQKESQRRGGRLLSLLSDNKVSTAGAGEAGGQQHRGVEQGHEATLFRALRTTLRTLVLTVSKTGSY